MSLTADFLASPLEFAKLKAICPPNNIEGYKGKDATTLDTSNYAAVGPDSGNPTDAIRYARVMQAKRIGYLEMFSDARPGGASAEERNDEGAGVVRMRAKFASFGEAAPVYFLPWDESGAIVRLRIPAKGTQPGVDPDVFFTAAINGCSVFVQGDPDSPTIYHAGGNTGRRDHNDSARFWRHALHKHIQDSRSATGRGQVTAEVNKTHYVKSPGTRGNASTVTAEAYEKELKERLDKKGSFRITSVFPWGCVFGVRTGDDWAFYLQENGTVRCDYVSKKAVRTVAYAKPMQLTKIFPGGTSGVARMTHMVPVKID